MLPPLSVGEMTLRLYAALNYSQNSRSRPSARAKWSVSAFLQRGYVHITNSKQRKHLSPSARCAGTSKGVFVTTSDFTNTAKDYVARSPKAHRADRRKSTRAPHGHARYRGAPEGNRCLAITSRLQVMMEPHTYDLKEGNERHVHRSRPKTRFKNEMTPSIPQRNRRRR